MNFIENIPQKLFITGIGTDVGKSYATGWLARTLRENNVNAITQKLIQTGNKDYSEDIDVHRRIMKIDMQPADLDHTTAPIILSYPCSPDLAAKLDNVDVDFSIADKATEKLASLYDAVLIEGAGGVMAPLKGEWLQLDYARERNLPVAIVANGQLGSINHILLTLAALHNAEINVWGLIYNPYFDKDKTIAEDTKQFVRSWLKKRFPQTHFIEMPQTL